MKIKFKQLKQLINEAIFKFNLPDSVQKKHPDVGSIEVDRDSKWDAAHAAAYEYFEKYGIRGVDPFTLKTYDVSQRYKTTDLLFFSNELTDTDFTALDDLTNKFKKLKSLTIKYHGTIFYDPRIYVLHRGNLSDKDKYIGFDDGITFLKIEKLTPMLKALFSADYYYDQNVIDASLIADRYYKVYNLHYDDVCRDFIKSLEIT